MERREMMTADVPAVGPIVDSYDSAAILAETRSLNEVYVDLGQGIQAAVDVPNAASLAADANSDGAVNARDYMVWAQHLYTGTSDGPTAGEFNGDGTVDGVDYLFWANQVAPSTEADASRLDGWDLETLGVPLPTNEAELIATLNMLPPLPKLHHSSPWNYSWDNPELGEAIARTTGSVGLSTYYHDTLAEVRRAVRIAKSTGAVVDFQYSPYHRLYAKSDPRDWGEDFQAALDEINSTFVTAAINFARAKVLENALDVQIGVILADQEILRSDIGPDGTIDPYGPHYADQLEAVRIKNDLVYLAAKTAFPEATFVWHVFPDSPHHSPDQWHDGVASTELYANRGPDTLRYMVKEFVAGVDSYNDSIEPHSQRRPLTMLMPAISVGGFYDVSVAGPQPGYVRDVPYPVKYSWYKGRNLNHSYFASERFADRVGPTYQIDELYLWPGPIENGHAGYYEHFVAYVAGTANLKMSEGDWFDLLDR
jgi:hypothetical protein